MTAYGQFLRGLIAQPHAVSAPTPSSAPLAAAIAANVDISRPGLVVELGPGTGVVTEVLLARGLAPERLLAIESCSYFAGLLRHRLRQVEVVQGDAFDFERYLPQGAQVAAVVSGIPLLLFSPARRHALITRALAAQPPGGEFIQLSYGWQPPIAAGSDFQLRRTLVWRNFPPAHIWTFCAQPQRRAARARLPIPAPVPVWQ